MITCPVIIYFGGFALVFRLAKNVVSAWQCMLLFYNIHLESQCLLRTIAGQNLYVQDFQNDNSLASTHGVQKSCAFSFLKSFHPIGCLPPDVMHEILEGLMGINFVVVVKGCI